MDHLLAAWQPYAELHEWTLPDGFHARVPVMNSVDFKVEVDELDHATFTHRIFENVGSETGLSIAANVIHSIDGMLVREMQRRCNHDDALLRTVAIKIAMYLDNEFATTKADYSEFISINLVDAISSNKVQLEDISKGKLVALYEVITKSLEHKAFPVVCVHDEFKCHPNNMNELRQHYINMFSELSKSNLLADILSQIHGTTNYNIPKLGDVSAQIEQSNYALS